MPEEGGRPGPGAMRQLALLNVGPTRESHTLLALGVSWALRERGLRLLHCCASPHRGWDLDAHEHSHSSITGMPVVHLSPSSMAREEMVGAVVEGHGRAADLALITGCDAALLERACSANAATTSSSNGGTSADTGSSNSSSGASDRAQGCLEACADVARGLGSPAILVVEVGCTVGSTSGTPGGAHGGGGSLITRGGAPGAPVSAAALTAAAFVAAAAVRETWTAHPGLPVVGVLATEVAGPGHLAELRLALSHVGVPLPLLGALPPQHSLQSQRRSDWQHPTGSPSLGLGLPSAALCGAHLSSESCDQVASLLPALGALAEECAGLDSLLGAVGWLNQGCTGGTGLPRGGGSQRGHSEVGSGVGRLDSSGGMEPGSRLGAPSGLPRISTNGRPSPAGPSGGRHTHAAVGPAIFGGAHGYAAGVSPRTPHEAGPAGIGAGVPSVTRHSVSLYRGASGMPSLYGGSSGAQSVSADILGFYAKSPRRRARPGHGQQRGSGQRLRRMSSQSSSGDWSLGAPHAAHHAGRLGGAGVGERQRMPGQLRVGVARDAAFPLTQDQAAYLTQLQDAGVEVVFFSPLACTALPRGLDAVLLRGSQPLALPLAHRLAANRTLAASLRAFAASGGAVLGEGSGVCTMADTLVVEGPTGAGGAHLGQTAASGAYGKETGGDGGAGTAQEDGGTVLPMFGLLRLTAHQKNCDLRRPSPCTVVPHPQCPLLGQAAAPGPGAGVSPIQALLPCWLQVEPHHELSVGLVLASPAPEEAAREGILRIGDGSGGSSSEGRGSPTGVLSARHGVSSGATSGNSHRGGSSSGSSSSSSSGCISDECAEHGGGAPSHGVGRGAAPSSKTPAGRPLQLLPASLPRSSGGKPQGSHAGVPTGVPPSAHLPPKAQGFFAPGAHRALAVVPLLDFRSNPMALHALVGQCQSAQGMARGAPGGDEALTLHEGSGAAGREGVGLLRRRRSWCAPHAEGGGASRVRGSRGASEVYHRGESGSGGDGGDEEEEEEEEGWEGWGGGFGGDGGSERGYATGRGSRGWTGGSFFPGPEPGSLASEEADGGSTIGFWDNRRSMTEVRGGGGSLVQEGDRGAHLEGYAFGIRANRSVPAFLPHHLSGAGGGLGARHGQPRGEGAWFAGSAAGAPALHQLGVGAAPSETECLCPRCTGASPCQTPLSVQSQDASWPSKLDPWGPADCDHIGAGRGADTGGGGKGVGGGESYLWGVAGAPAAYPWSTSEEKHGSPNPNTRRMGRIGSCEAMLLSSPYSVRSCQDQGRGVHIAAGGGGGRRELGGVVRPTSLNLSVRGVSSEGGPRWEENPGLFADSRRTAEGARGGTEQRRRHSSVSLSGAGTPLAYPPVALSSPGGASHGFQSLETAEGVGYGAQYGQRRMERPPSAGTTRDYSWASSEPQSQVQGPPMWGKDRRSWSAHRGAAPPPPYAPWGAEAGAGWRQEVDRMVFEYERDEEGQRRAGGGEGEGMQGVVRGRRSLPEMGAVHAKEGMPGSWAEGALGEWAEGVPGGALGLDPWQRRGRVRAAGSVGRNGRRSRREGRRSSWTGAHGHTRGVPSSDDLQAVPEEVLGGPRGGTVPASSSLRTTLTVEICDSTYTVGPATVGCTVTAGGLEEGPGEGWRAPEGSEICDSPYTVGPATVGCTVTAGGLEEGPGEGWRAPEGAEMHPSGALGAAVVPYGQGYQGRGKGRPVVSLSAAASSLVKLLGLGDNLQGLSQECLPALLASVERLAAQGCDPGTPGDQPSVLASAAASLTAAYAPGAIIVIARRGLSAGGRGGLLLVGGPDGAPQAPWDHALRAVGPLLGHLGRALGRTFLSTFLGSGRVPRRQSPLAAEAAAAKRGAGGAARGEGGAGAGAVDRGGSPGEKAEIGLCTKGEEGPTVVILQPQTLSDTLESLVALGTALGVADESRALASSLRVRLRAVARALAASGTRRPVSPAVAVVFVLPAVTLGAPLGAPYRAPNLASTPAASSDVMGAPGARLGGMPSAEWVQEAVALAGGQLVYLGVTSPSGLCLEPAWHCSRHEGCTTAGSGREGGKASQGLVAASPQAVFLVGDTPDVESMAGVLRRLPGALGVPAVAARDVFRCSPALLSPSGPGFVDGIEAMASVLHPGKLSKTPTLPERSFEMLAIAPAN